MSTMRMTRTVVRAIVAPAGDRPAATCGRNPADLPCPCSHKQSPPAGALRLGDAPAGKVAIDKGQAEQTPTGAASAGHDAHGPSVVAAPAPARSPKVCRWRRDARTARDPRFRSVM
jgi:hypothetical protein